LSIYLTHPKEFRAHGVEYLSYTPKRVQGAGQLIPLPRTLMTDQQAHWAWF
jgi:hypothetical protein